MSSATKQRAPKISRTVALNDVTAAHVKDVGEQSKATLGSFVTDVNTEDVVRDQFEAVLGSIVTWLVRMSGEEHCTNEKLHKAVVLANKLVTVANDSAPAVRIDNTSINEDGTENIDRGGIICITSILFCKLNLAVDDAKDDDNNNDEEDEDNNNNEEDEDNEKDDKEYNKARSMWRLSTKIWYALSDGRTEPAKVELQGALAFLLTVGAHFIQDEHVGNRVPAIFHLEPCACSEDEKALGTLLAHFWSGNSVAEHPRANHIALVSSRIVNLLRPHPTELLNMTMYVGKLNDLPEGSALVTRLVNDVYNANGFQFTDIDSSLCSKLWAFSKKGLSTRLTILQREHLKHLIRQSHKDTLGE